MWLHLQVKDFPLIRKLGYKITLSKEKNRNVGQYGRSNCKGKLNWNGLHFFSTHLHVSLVNPNS